jgi:hypothetical protein
VRRIAYGASGRSWIHGTPGNLRGGLHGRVIELDEPVDGVEAGEVQIRSVQTATTRLPDLLDVIATLPEGHRTRLTWTSR